MAGVPIPCFLSAIGRVLAVQKNGQKPSEQCLEVTSNSISVFRVQQIFFKATCCIMCGSGVALYLLYHILKPAGGSRQEGTKPLEPPMAHHRTNLALDPALFDRMAVALEHQGIRDPTGISAWYLKWAPCEPSAQSILMMMVWCSSQMLLAYARLLP